MVNHFIFVLDSFSLIFAGTLTCEFIVFAKVSYRVVSETLTSCNYVPYNVISILLVTCCFQVIFIILHGQKCMIYRYIFAYRAYTSVV